MMLPHHKKQFSGWIYIVRLALVVASLAGPGTVESFAQSVLLFDSIAAAHGLKLDTPHSSVQMTGVVDRGGKSEPFRLIATAEGQLRIEYGSAGRDVLVMTPKLIFHDDGTRITFDKVPPGFSQLDITGPFLMEQLSRRTVQVERTLDRVVVGDTPTQRVRLESDSSEMHKGSIRVIDRLDLYLDTEDRLAGISRTFYAGRPETYSQAFSFSDYRKTDGVLLPYKIGVEVNAKRRQTFKVDQYQFDVPLDRSQFVGARAK